MRKYLWMVAMISATTVYVCADNNPFNLKENLQKIDRDQDFLLSAFQDIVDKQEKLDELNLDESDEIMAIDKDKKIIDDLNVSAEDIDTVKAVEERNITKDMTLEKEKKKVLKKEEKNIQQAKEEKIKQEKARRNKEQEELKRLEKVKLEQLKIEEERKKQEKLKQEKAKKDKLEALRIEKLKREKEKLEEQEKQETKQKKVEAIKVSKRENSKQVKQKVVIEKLSSEAIVDINITQEKLIETEEADKVYLEAVKEMDED